MSCTCDHCQKRKYPITHLEEWRKASCFSDAWGFWQWDHDKLRVKGKSACYSIVRQSNASHGCPADVLGRENIASAILEAEQIFRDRLGFSVVPEWHSKTVDGWQWGCNHSWRNSGQLVLPYGDIIAVGKEVLTEIANVKRGTTKYKIESKRGAVLDTFTIKIPVDACVKPENILVFIDKAERTNDCESGERWRIPTECITIENGQATITGNSYLLAKPELYESMVPFSGPVSYYNDYSLNPDHLENYVDRLSIVHRTIDSCEGGRAISHKRPCGCTKCCSKGVAICGTCSNVTFCIDDRKAGIISPLWSFGGGCSGMPDSFCVNFQAGDCNRNWTGDIARLAIARLCSPICGCAYGCMSRWSEDMAHESAKSTVSFDVLNNPIGTRRGEIEAWRVIKQFKNQIFMI